MFKIRRVFHALWLGALLSFFGSGEAAIVNLQEGPGLGDSQAIPVVVFYTNGTTAQRQAYYNPAVGGLEIDTAGNVAAVYLPTFGIRYILWNGYWVNQQGYYWNNGVSTPITIADWNGYWDSYWRPYGNVFYDNRALDYRRGAYPRYVDRANTYRAYRDVNPASPSNWYNEGDIYRDNLSRDNLYRSDLDRDNLYRDNLYRGADIYRSENYRMNMDSVFRGDTWNINQGNLGNRTSLDRETFGRDDFERNSVERGPNMQYFGPRDQDFGDRGRGGRGR